MLHVTDSQIKEDLIRELAHHLRLDLKKIEISVDRYIVTLGGTVESPLDQLLAQDVAWRVEGVMGVVNNLRTEAAPRADAEVAQSVKQALELDSYLPEAEIQLTVTNGWVALEGTVNYTRERVGAERLTRRIAGVRGVYNNIVVNPAEARRENVCHTIGEALKHRAELEAKNIQVRLQDSTVTLSGQVHSWEERCAIINAASRVPGVEVVKDGLSIEPHF